MALTPRLAVARRNLALNAALDIGTGGKIRIYDGTQPTDADTALGSQVMLVELAMASTPFAAASGGSKAAGSITNGTIAASGTASWGSILNSSDVRLFDFSVGTSGANLNFDSVAFSSGATASISGLTATMAVG
jgi:hypothetical protein